MRVFNEEEATQQSKRFLTGRQIAWLIYEYFKTGDTDGFILDFKRDIKKLSSKALMCRPSTLSGMRPSSPRERRHTSKVFYSFK